MASLIFAQAKSIRKSALKQANMWRDNAAALGTSLTEAYDKGYELAITTSRNEFREIIAIATLLHEDYKEVSQLSPINYYFITIRPDEKLIDFDSFYTLVKKFINRACFIDYTLSFEQKGITDETLGVGFHCHIVANMTQRSRKEALRDTQSTFKSCTAPNCIDVKTTRNPKELVENYMIAYESDDGHKIVTKTWDEKWRESKGLQNTYEEALPVRKTHSVSSPGQSVIVYEGATIDFL